MLNLDTQIFGQMPEKELKWFQTIRGEGSKLPTRTNRNRKIHNVINILRQNQVRVSVALTPATPYQIVCYNGQFYCEEDEETCNLIVSEFYRSNEMLVISKRAMSSNPMDDEFLDEYNEQSETGQDLAVDDMSLADEDLYAETFAQRLSELMKNGGYKKSWLAQACGVTPLTVDNWLHNKYPRCEAVIRLSEIFHVSIDYLLLGK